jgi:hypothetical protein
MSEHAIYFPLFRLFKRLRRSPKLTRFCSVKVIQAENAMGKGMQESSMEGITASKQE